MFDPEQLPELKRMIREATHGDSDLLAEVFREVTALRPVVAIQPRNTNSISLVASDGGNNRLTYNPFSLQVVRVVDTYGQQLFLDVISPTTDTVALGQRHLDAMTPLGKMMDDLGVSRLADLSPMIPEENKSRSWPLVYRDLCEWAVLYDLICKQTWGSDTLVIRDGLLRTKIFAGELFIDLYTKLKDAIERTRRERRRDIFVVGIAKHSRVLERYRLAMAVADVFPAGHPRYAAVPMSMQSKVYTWEEYLTSPEDDPTDAEKPKYNMGAMYLVRFGKMSADPVWTVDLMEFQKPRAQQILGSLVSDAEQGFPVPCYPHCLQEADRHAQVVDLDLAILQRELEEAVREQVPHDRRPVFDAQVLSVADPAAREVPVTLFEKDRVVGTFLGFSEGGLEFHADLILPYKNFFQSSPMHGQFVIVGLENDEEAILGRITTIAAQGRLVSAAGEDYALRQQREDRPVPEDLRDQFLKYRVDIRILGMLRDRGIERGPIFVASHRRLPHVGAKVAFLSDDLLEWVSGARAAGSSTVQIGFLAFGEFVYSGNDQRVGEDARLQLQDPAVLPRFDVNQLVSRRSFVFARAGFGKSNLVKLLFADLYGNGSGPTVPKKGGRETPVGTVIFDPDGEYYWPDDKERPGLCDVPALQDRLAVFTDKEADSAFYQSFVVDKVKLDIRELQPSKVISLVIPPERQDNQNVVKLKGLRGPQWRGLVDAVYAERGGTDLQVFYDALQLQPERQEAEALAARANMVRVVGALHDPSSQLLPGLRRALEEGRLCVVDISQMRGAQGLALAGVILQELFEGNQAEFTKKDSRSIPVIAVVEEAQSVLGATASQGEGPFVAWVKEGRKYDLGAMLITQQPGSIPQEILSQGDNWFVFHLLSEGDLRAVRKANAHFSDDLLSSLLNEPIPGHGVFWSSSGETPYPVPIRALLFEAAYAPLDPQYDRSGVNCYASQLRNKLRGALSDAVAVVGGKPATVAGTEDATETYTYAAIRKLADSPEFQEQVRGRGIPWRRVQVVLAGHLPEILGRTVEQREDWVVGQSLVKRALTDILGPEEEGWRTERRERKGGGGKPVTWIIATQQAKQRGVTLPEPSDDWPPEDWPFDDQGDPLSDGLF